MRILKQFLSNNNGVALIEFALVLPMLLALLLGAAEVTRYIMILQKVERAGYVLTDIVTQYTPASATGGAGEITVTEMNNVFNQYTRIMRPFDEPARQALIFTSVRRERPLPAQAPVKRVQWQIAAPANVGLLTTDVSSAVNGLSPTTISPAVRLTNTSFTAEYESQLGTMPECEVMIVGEVFYRYEPFAQPVLQRIGVPIPARTITRRMFFTPRHGKLIDLPPTFPYVLDTRCP